MARVSSVSAEDKDHPLEETLPELKEEEIEMIKEWIDQDRAYEGEYRKMKEAMTKELKDALEPHPFPPWPRPNHDQALGLVGRPIRWFEKSLEEQRGHKQSTYALVWPHKKAQEKENFYKKLGRKPIVL